jgi:hypothetical protein
VPLLPYRFLLLISVLKATGGQWNTCSCSSELSELLRGLDAFLDDSWLLNVLLYSSLGLKRFTEAILVLFFSFTFEFWKILTMLALIVKSGLLDDWRLLKNMVSRDFSTLDFAKVMD